MNILSLILRLDIEILLFKFITNKILIGPTLIQMISAVVLKDAILRKTPNILNKLSLIKINSIIT